MSDPIIKFTRLPCLKCGGECQNPESCEFQAVFMVDTNYQIDYGLLKKIDQVPGINSFAVCSRYEAVLRPAKLFDPDVVKADIRRVFHNHVKSSLIDQRNIEEFKNGCLRLPNGVEIPYNSADPNQSSIANNIASNIDGASAKEEDC